RLLVAAELDARVRRDIQLDIDLEDEVAVGLLGPQEAVLPRANLADDGFALDGVRSPAADLLPAAQRLAVEERDEACSTGLGCKSDPSQTRGDEKHDEKSTRHRSGPFRGIRSSRPSRWGRSDHPP